MTFKLEGVSLEVRKAIHRDLKYENPAAKYMPAAKLYKWDGAITFFNMGGTGYVNHLDRVLTILDKKGVTVSSVDDRRVHHEIEFNPINDSYWGDTCWPERHSLAGQPIRLRDYQVDAVNNFLTKPQGVQQLPTGSGKTIILATLSKICETHGRTIVIVPNRSLVTQTLEDYTNCGLNVGVFYGGERQTDRTHTICTWQSLESANKAYKNAADVTTTDLYKLTQGVTTIICDETHTVKANVLRKLLSNTFKNVPIRWGLTGTIPKVDYEYETLVATLGPVITRIKPKTLQDAGFLSNCFIHVKQLIDNPEFRTYQEELRYLVTEPSRVAYISNMINDIRVSGNTLVLVDRILAGQQIADSIENAVFVSGSMDTDDRKHHYDSIDDSNNQVIVATYQVAAVGINLVNIHHVVLIEPGKSFVRVIQSIGRGLRRSSSKDFVDIWDITSSCKFSKRHLTARKKFYNESEYAFKVERIKWSQ